MAETPLQDASGSGIAQAYGEGATATVNVTGYGPEAIAILMRDERTEHHAKIAQHRAKIKKLSNQLNVTDGAVRGFLRILAVEEVSPEQLATKLEEIARRHNGLVARLGALDPEDDVARGLIEQARKVVRSAASMADYDRADDLLFEAEEAHDPALRGAEALEREAHETARRLRLSKASTRGERAELSLTRLDYLKAAEHFRAAAEIVAEMEFGARFSYSLQSANALKQYGDEKGDNSILRLSIVAYREMLLWCQRERMPLEWAITQNNLGNALSTLGGRESETERLEEAVAAYRSALQEQTRERVPLDWSMTQNNLGCGLQKLGERERGVERLEEAVAAHRCALQERTRGRAPQEWAATQHNLGSALLRIGGRESGLERLGEAVAAFRSALEERTRERFPQEWAATQNNLGSALQLRGERERGVESLEEAVAAHRSALEEYSRERVPLDWAMTQSNLGVALQALGWRQSGVESLKEAVSACRLALEEYSRERVPLDWAMTENNLGNALQRLGERESGVERLEEAVAAYRLALEEYSRERVPLQWATTQGNLGNALRSLGRRESGVETLEEAANATRAAWDVYTEASIDQFDRDLASRMADINWLIARRRWGWTGLFGWWENSSTTTSFIPDQR